jgi:predicted transposase YbfD/YdcC
VVSVWVGDQSISLSELEVSEKSNEIIAVPKLLEMLDIEGDIVTADAMSCQKDRLFAIWCERIYVISFQFK